MDAAAVKEIVKAIKEGAKSMTPLANEYINQVRYNGIINIAGGITVLIVMIIFGFVLRNFFKKSIAYEYDYGNKIEGLSGIGIAISIFAGFGYIISTLFLISTIYTGLSELISPLYYLIN